LEELLRSFGSFKFDLGWSWEYREGIKIERQRDTKKRRMWILEVLEALKALKAWFWLKLLFEV
jgi:hypothetical protein